MKTFKITNIILSMLILSETIAPLAKAVTPLGDVCTSDQESTENSLDKALLKISESLYNVNNSLDETEIEGNFSSLNQIFSNKDSLKTMYVSRDTAAKCLNSLIAGENKFKQQIKSTFSYNTQEEIDEHYISILNKTNAPITEFIKFLFHMLYRKTPGENITTDSIVLNHDFPSIYQAVKNVILKHKADNLNDSQDIIEYTFSLSSEFELKEIMEMMLDINGGAIENLWNYTGATGFLSFVCYSKNIDIIKIAVKLGGDINYVDFYGYTPLCNAIERNQPEIVNLLLDNGADPNVPIYIGSPLKLAILSGYSEIAETLIDKGAEINEEIINLAEERHLSQIFHSIPKNDEHSANNLSSKSENDKLPEQETLEQSQSSSNIFLVCLNKFLSFFK